ncbi:MAG: UDP-N-acetylglucosamine 1-carboxyvinyltransferase [Clostridia bacterium]|nr:UDP-N-acetylglucosamine 1-carboxyvinyltransferase [Clostridia bacterium]
MDRFEIIGGHKLEGKFSVQGAKNSCLPIIAASMLVQGETVLHNCPDLKDTEVAVSILKSLGCYTKRQGNDIYINSDVNLENTIPEELMSKMRSSIMFLGPLLSRNKCVRIYYPGGCKLGPRPINYHIDAFKILGAETYEEENSICFKNFSAPPREITLEYPSVGVTENIMTFLAVGQGDEIRIKNPAREPEILDLQNFLNSAGAKIKGAGNEEIIIKPVEKLHNTEYNIMPDRIATLTYLTSVAMCGGDVIIDNAVPEHIRKPLLMLEEAGAEIRDNYGIRLISHRGIKALGKIETGPYPDFPTDAQACFSALMSMSEGETEICENVFTSRFSHCCELEKMGADISFCEGKAVVKGVKRLKGAEVYASDLRCGAALVAAGLSAEGRTKVYGTEFIDRGYENIEKVLRKIGADIKRLS